MQCHVPELGLLFAIPNGGKRGIATAARLKLEGVKPGVPDLMLPVARQGFHGLFIEMKRTKGSSVSREQKTFATALQQQRYRVEVAKGFLEARQIIIDYFEGESDATNKN